MKLSIKKSIWMVMASLCSYISASAYDFEINGLGYTVISHVDLTCEVSELVDKNLSEIEIPSYVNFKDRELKVISIGINAFQSSSITKLSIPPSIQSLTGGTGPFSDGGYFKNCKNLTNVEFQPNSCIPEIPTECFSGCSSLININIPKSVTTIGCEAFTDCVELSSIDISSCTRIGSNAFCNCSSLKQIIMADSECIIEKAAFASSGVSHVNIPEGCKLSLYSAAFTNCKDLKEITLPVNTNLYSDEGYRGIFEGCTSIQCIQLPDSVKDIPSRTFMGCSSLQNVIMPDYLKTVGRNAFERTSIEKILLPPSVKKIDFGAFMDCGNLKEMILSGSPTIVLYEGGYFKNQSNGKYEYREQDFTLSTAPIEKLIIGYGDSITFKYYFNDSGSTGYKLLDSKSISDALPPINHIYLDNPKFIGGESEWVQRWSAEWQKYYYTGERIDHYEKVCISFPSLEVLELGTHIFAAEGIDWNLPKLKKLISYACTPPIIPSLDNNAYLNWEVIVPADCLELYQKSPSWENFWNLKGDPNISVIQEVTIPPNNKSILEKFNLNGIHVDDNYKGIVIVKYSDGSMDKIIQ